MTDLPVPFDVWSDRGEYPSRNVLYSWTRPGHRCEELKAAKVIMRVHGRWLFNPARWREYAERHAA